MSELTAVFVICVVFLLILIFRGNGSEKPDRGRNVERRPRALGQVTNEDLVTIASFYNPGVAHIAKAKLESEGIDSYIANDVMATIDYPQALIDGGVHLRVRESEAESAREILR